MQILTKKNIEGGRERERGDEREKEMSIFFFFFRYTEAKTISFFQYVQESLKYLG